MDGGCNDIAARVAADHEALHARLGRLLRSVPGEGDDRPIDRPLQGELDALLDAVRQHFHREEIWMDAAGLVTLSHARDHDRLAGELSAIVAQVSDGTLAAPIAVRRMAQALADHETHMDMTAFAIRLSPVTW